MIMAPNGGTAPPLYRQYHPCAGRQRQPMPMLDSSLAPAACRWGRG
jgi:hypothetical protein